MVSLLRRNVAGAIYDALQSSSSSSHFRLGPNCTREKVAALVSIPRLDKKAKVEAYPQCAVDVDALFRQGKEMSQMANLLKHAYSLY